MDPFTIGAIIASVAGAGLQAKAQQDAARRQNAEIQRSLENQRRLQMEAEQKAMSTAQTFETPKRAEQQQQIAEQITQELIQPVSESQAIRSQQQTTQGNVSDDYVAARAASELNTMKAAEQLARLLGKTTSASRLRFNEGVRMMDAGMDINRLGSFSRGQDAADRIAIDTAGRPDGGTMLVGSILQGAGQAGMMAGGSNVRNITTAGAYGTNPFSQQTAMLAAQDAGLRPNRFIDAFRGMTQPRI